ncbi:MAG: InlB B-repeat-containing protein [Candidatus Methanomethylophilaceae archaeon]|nr:InlB B-repeat-containing protein [Candidatus Methanomethylophilaceae archaeon]
MKDNTIRMIAVISAALVVVCALMIIIPSEIEATGAGTEQDPVDLGTKICWTYSPIFLPSSGTQGDEVRWEFGDNVVLDSRDAGLEEYAALLTAHKGNVWKPVHTYVAKGTYTVKQCVIGGENGELEHWSKIVVQVMGDPIVTFDSDGGSNVASQTVPKQYSDYDYVLQKVFRPADPTRVGYTFDGWYLVSGTTVSENEFDFNQGISESITLRAKWASGEGAASSDDLQKFIEDNAIAIILTGALAVIGAITYVTRNPVLVAITALLSVAVLYMWFTGGKI